MHRTIFMIIFLGCGENTTPPSPLLISAENQVKPAGKSEKHLNFAGLYEAAIALGRRAGA